MMWRRLQALYSQLPKGLVHISLLFAVGLLTLWSIKWSQWLARICYTRARQTR